MLRRSLVWALPALVATTLFGASLAAYAATPAAVFTAAVNDPARSAKDRERDAREKPAEVLAFAGIQPGMTVLDFFGGGGYYSELIANVVGPQGKVLLVNNAPYTAFAKDDLKTRFEGRSLPNIERMTVESCDLRMGKNKLDAAVIVMSYHDLYYVDEKDGWAPIDGGKVLDQLHAALKPGGMFLIVDHAAKDGTGNKAAQDLHRIEEVFAKRDIESHGFRLEKSYDGLRNTADDRSKLVFDPSIRGKTDRFVHVYRKI